MDWNKLQVSRSEANGLFEKYKAGGEFDYNEDFKELAKKLRECWKKAKETGAKENDKDNAHYLCDLTFAMDLYNLLDCEGFTQWEAADNEIWAGLVLKVIPDIFKERWPLDDKDDHSQRWIYKRTWRVWTKTLWWFIYLSMVTDERGKLDVAATMLQLCNLEATSIDDFLDRCGMGFRVDFCRKLMKRYSEYIQDKKIAGTKRRATFRFVVSQAYLRSGNIDPDLCGHDSFLDSIFAMLEPKAQ